MSGRKPFYAGLSGRQAREDKRSVRYRLVPWDRNSAL